MRDGFVLRHDPREVTEEKQPIEGAFLACTLWLADACVLTGDIDRAQALFDQVVRWPTISVSLPKSSTRRPSRQTGNFPQASPISR